MAPGKRQVKARRHLVCNHCHSLVDFAVSGCGKTWSETTEEGFTFQCLECWKVAGGKVSNQGDAKRRSYSEAVIEGALRTERVFMGDSILRKTDRTLSKGEDVVVCLPELG